VVLDTPHGYAAPARLGLNHWALAGDWTVGRRAIVLNQAGGRILYRFHARDLHLVMADHKAWIAFRYDGQGLEPEHGGPPRLLVPYLFWGD
jgi:hypothetical protein